MGFWSWLHRFVIRQRCMPWRVRLWLGKRYPRLLVFLQSGRTNINTARNWDAMWDKTGPDGDRWCIFPNKFARIAELVGPDARVVDVGCGVGILLELLREKQTCRGTGIDISPKAIDMVRAKGFEGVVAELPDLPLPDDAFDAAVGTELIEHLDRPDLALVQMARIVRPGGLVIVSTPDETMGTEDQLWHLHTFNRNSLRELLAQTLDDVGVERIVEEGFEADFLLAWGTVRD
jgi:2-polyprenyl-3-methyl-5-hydroxy-6-metoxy-1,4-benzoquinol methylase